MGTLRQVQGGGEEFRGGKAVHHVVKDIDGKSSARRQVSKYTVVNNRHQVDGRSTKTKEKPIDSLLLAIAPSLHSANHSGARILFMGIRTNFFLKLLEG